MAKQNAIIRKLPAVETLGSTTIICSDKTGTLTQNEMTVKVVYAADEVYEVHGVGYEPKGEITTKGKTSYASNHAFIQTMKAGLLCNSSNIIKQENEYKIVGDPTEAALIVSAQGSLEKILQRCESMLDAKNNEVPVNQEAIIKQAEEMAKQGMRVLAFASLKLTDILDSLEHHHVQENLVFLGLQAMIDPPRQEVKSSIKKCHEAGIEVKMITGDHQTTALAIARHIGLKINAKIQSLSGGELENMSDEALLDVIEQVNVFARVTPEQKLRLVKLLQSKNNIVAMRGFRYDFNR
jgi:magnesium-transporting ATPase (P-type)